jgi:hypothetical protein
MIKDKKVIKSLLKALNTIKIVKTLEKLFKTNQDVI